MRPASRGALTARDDGHVKRTTLLYNTGGWPHHSRQELRHHSQALRTEARGGSIEALEKESVFARGISGPGKRGGTEQAGPAGNDR